MSKPILNINNQHYPFSEEEIASFIQTIQDFKDDKTTARDWVEIEKELNDLYANNTSQLNQPLT